MKKIAFCTHNIESRLNVKVAYNFDNVCLQNIILYWFTNKCFNLKVLLNLFLLVLCKHDFKQMSELLETIYK